eukprot:TRINITY_DN607_c0_g1_i1.p1 TRINITY_DN607_c0_g1~~TRINITY_DN607_c0_g1_i1.p1  ORF type:complete len:376 (+),score=103.06 TRINITY_DN607_c0_g1_i1:333-1460(+)
MHLCPSGILHPGKMNVLGNGVVLDVPALLEELASLEKSGVDTKGKLLLSTRAQLLFDCHKIIDGLSEKYLGRGEIGTTKKGIGPCYSTKASRTGLRVGDLLDYNSFVQKHAQFIKQLQNLYHFDYNIAEEADKYKLYLEQIRPMIMDTVYWINAAMNQGKTILAEGANAALLDTDFGTYPFVTSSHTTAGGASCGLGIAPSKIDSCIGIAKAYTTRVGSGPFPTELLDSVGDQLRKTGHEFGTTTGRPRRIGWLDIPVLQYSHMLNNYSSLNLTKLDVLNDLPEVKIGVCYRMDGKLLEPGQMPSTVADLARVEVVYETLKGWQTDISKIYKFEDLPAEAKTYIRRIEELTGVPLSWIGTGAARESMLTNGFNSQ